MNQQATLESAIARYIAGDDRAGNEVCASLEVDARSTVLRFLPAADLDVDDVVQDSLVSFLRYLRRAGVAPNNPRAFVATIARNRCLNLHLRRRRRHTERLDDTARDVPSDHASPLDLLEAEQTQRIVADAVTRLEDGCQDLLQAVYRDRAPIERLRQQLGLKTVQAVYHRRKVCLQKLRDLLNEILFEGRKSGNREMDPASTSPRKRGTRGE